MLHILTSISANLSNSMSAIRKLRPKKPFTIPGIIAVIMLTLTIFYLGFRQHDTHTLRIIAEAGADGPVQVFFDTGTGFSEPLSATAMARAGPQSLEFDVPSGQVQNLRIDLAAQSGTMLLREVNLVSAAADINILDLSAVAFSNRVDVAVADEGFILSFDDENADPYVVFALDQQIDMVSRKLGLLPHLMLFALAAIAALYVHNFSEFSRSIPALIAGFVLALVISMAFLSPIGSHPDENLHIADASYFRDAWLPPVLDGDSLALSLSASPWGVSYLVDWNIVYFLAAKFALVMETLGFDFEQGLRLFNVAVFVGVLAVFARLRADPLYLGFLFIVPQTWYVISYFNGDAFPLLVSFIAVVLGTQKDGQVERFLSGSAKLSPVVILFAACIALLIVSKKNYYFALLFIISWQLVRMLQIPRSVFYPGIFLLSVLFLAFAFPDFRQIASPWFVFLIVSVAAPVALLVTARFLITTLRSNPERRANLKRGAVIYVVGLCLALPWIGFDVARNGFGDHKAETIRQLMDAHAAPELRPSSVIETPELSYPGIRLADKGVQFEALASEPYNWFHVSFRSFYAGFGYMEFFASDEAYAIFGLLVGLLLLVGLSSRTRADADWDIFLFLAVSLSAMVVFASYAHSWTYDFQPQGRYLFSLISIASPFLLIAANQPKLKMIAQALILVGFVNSATVFLQLGLGNLHGYGLGGI